MTMLSPEPAPAANTAPRFAIHRIEGTSMLPALPPGSHVLVDRLASVAVGDVVVCGGGRVAHRVVKCGGGRALTQGDNRPTPDGYVHLNSIEGRAVLVRSNESGWRAVPRVPRGRLWHTRPAKRAWKACDAIARKWRGMAGYMERFETQTLGREVAVHDQQTGRVHMLNATAARIWELARTGCAEAAIAEHLCREFPDVDPAQVNRDVTDTLNDLRSTGLLDTSERTTQ